jgi:hypothetical protein
MIIFKEVFVQPRKQKLIKLSQRKGRIIESSDEEELEIELNPQFSALIKEVVNPNEIKVKKKKKNKRKGKEMK